MKTKKRPVPISVKSKCGTTRVMLEFLMGAGVRKPDMLVSFSKGVA